MIPISYISPNNSLDSTGRPIHTPPPPSKSPGPYTGTSALRHAVPVAKPLPKTHQPTTQPPTQPPTQPEYVIFPKKFSPHPMNSPSVFPKSKSKSPGHLRAAYGVVFGGKYRKNKRNSQKKSKRRKTRKRKNKRKSRRRKVRKNKRKSRHRRR